eukprot:TRINITY_DN8316_c1_g1_i1.p1 TRINITY_DN8316_c1_g1~~TRINITY_DN8316_c1_g1_i1.p1  ORF type:complete len:437 (+),score=159.57 TRINITY_DN8316_c1_g1_i1:58-1368(+)
MEAVQVSPCVGSRSRREPIPTGTTRILLVVLKDLSVQVMVDDLFWIFSQFGVVEKLSSFTKNTKNQLLIQYETMQQAGVALSYLNGRTLNYFAPNSTPGSCRLEIVPSFLKVLTFKKLDARNRDYTPFNEEVRALFPANVAVRARQMGWQTRDFLWGQCIKGEGWLDPVQGETHKGTIPPAESLHQNTAGLPVGKVGDCVKLSGLPDESVLDAVGLFKVAGMYGEVVSAKLMAKRKGCALVQYTDGEGAERAVAMLDGVSLFGEKWEAVISKHANALHWDGAGTELQTRMCTARNEARPSVPPADIAGSPYHYLGAHGLPQNVDAQRVLKEVMKGHNPAEVSSFGDHVVAGFDKKEDALLAAAAVNGTKSLAGHLISLYFVKASHQDEEGDADEGDDWNDSFSSEADFRIKTEGYVLRRTSFSEEEEEHGGRQKTL